MLVPAHARMARAALKWSLQDLQKRTGLSKTTLVRFEAGLGVYQSTAIKLEETFGRAGIIFIHSDDVRGPGVLLSIDLARRVGGVTGRATSKSGKRSQKTK